MKPYISIILPCYNVAEFLAKCMESLEKQTIGIRNLELIFVDDASTDGGKTWNCILEFEQRYPENVIAIHLDENRCQGGARNRGLQYAQADYVGFLDPDDWIEPQMYEKLYQCITKYRCDAADCRLMMNMPDGRELIYRKVPEKLDQYEKSIAEGGTHWVTDLLGKHYGGGIVTGIYLKSLIVEHGIYFPECIKYEDNYWQYIFLLYVRSFCHLPDDLYHYRQNDISTVHGQNERYHFDRMEIELRKLSAYQKLGVYERFEKEIEWDFLGMYYLNTLYVLWTRFDKPPYAVFVEMTNKVRTLFPHYKENTYLRKEEGLNRMMIDLIEKDLDEQQFYEVGKIILEWRNSYDSVL